MIDVYMTDAATWHQYAGTDQWGEPNSPISTSVMCRIKWSSKMVRNFAGEQVVAAGSVLMKSSPSHQDHIEIDNVKHAILRVDAQKGFSAVSHYEVWIA